MNATITANNVNDLMPHMLMYALSGGRLYGTSFAGSDYDYRGVIVPPYDVQVNPLQKFEQWEHPTEDTVVYDWEKFFRLLVNGNPNIVELLFAPTDFARSIWFDVVDARGLFVTQRTVSAFMGYANAQYSMAYKKECSEERRNKYLMHFVRLLFQGEELLNTGSIIFPLSSASYLLSIRKGEVTKEEIDDLFQTRMSAFHDRKSELRPSPLMPDTLNLYYRVLKNF